MSSKKFIQNLIDRRQRIIDGKINCIPLAFPRLKEVYPGIERRKYNICTANQKVGKSKLTDKMMVYEPFFYSISHPDQLKIHILYFTLEMGKEEKFYEFLCHLLWKLDKIRISPTQLKSTDSAKPVPQSIINLINSEKYQYYISKFEETVEYIDTNKNPTGIWKNCKDFAEARGEWHYKKGFKKDSKGNSIEDDNVRDYFEAYDKDEYWIVILDNYSNLSSESNMNKMQTIDKMSKYFIDLRDTYNFSITAIQHQAQAQEGIENRKMNILEPTSDGMADCKTTVRDINCIFGLFSPYKYGIKRYPDNNEGYDITKFRNHIRFLKIIENRDGESGYSTALFFDGACSEFIELPPANDEAGLEVFYKQIEKLNNKKQL